MGGMIETLRNAWKITICVRRSYLQFYDDNI